VVTADEPPEDADEATALECTGLTKRFGDRVAVNDVGFTIARGESYGLLGPNGAGKTTTINLLCGLLDADEGEVMIAGRRLGTDPTVKTALVTCHRRSRCIPTSPVGRTCASSGGCTG
jgi:ABC-type multidrug transport system ATPase subunit